jgi:hypothetical protein
VNVEIEGEKYLILMKVVEKFGFAEKNPFLSVVHKNNREKIDLKT